MRTYTDDELGQIPSISFFKPDYCTFSMVWVWDRCCGNNFLFTGFNVVIYCGMIKISKEVGMSKRGRIKYQRESFFLFYQFKLLSYFVAVIHASPNTILKERCLG